MPKDVKIKICGMTRVEDVMAAVEAGADAVGFVFASKSPRQVTVENAARIAAVVPPYVMRAGVFVDAPEDEVTEAIQRCGLTLAQFHGAETPEYCQGFGVMTMKAIRVRDAGWLEEARAYAVDAILLDTYVPGQLGGTGAVFDWHLAARGRELGKPIFLAGGLAPENVAEAIRRAQPYGVDVSSGVEASPGRKDAEKIRRFVAAARGA